MKKTTQLKQILKGPGLSIMMEAHNGITAKIVEETGFKSIWASGLAISASLGVRDNNEASWTQVLETIEFMNEGIAIPILLDGDTGYGNFNNMQRLVKKLESRGIAGVCIEDKLFPKTNSFISGDKQPLASLEEFSKKIRAGKDVQRDSDFCIVARTEAFIAGWGLEEALTRAKAYAEAGADAILVHSKLATADEILAFARHWEKDCPIVIVPTKYPAVSLSVFEQAGIRLVIWANHTIRTVISAVQKNLRELYDTRNLKALDEKIVPVKEIFRLQGAEELAAAEKLYLPLNAAEVKVIVLASSKGTDFGRLTLDRPKSMIPIQGKPILAKQIATINECGIKKISVVRGYKKEAIKLPNLTYFDNDRFNETGELSTLLQAVSWLSGRMIITYGDILYEKSVLQKLLDDKHDITLMVDASWSIEKKYSRPADLVIGSKQPTMKFSIDSEISLVTIGNQLEKENVHGEWTGLVMLSPRGSDLLREELTKLERENPSPFHESVSFEKANLTDFFGYLVTQGYPIHIAYIYGQWIDIDNMEDLSDAYLHSELM